MPLRDAIAFRLVCGLCRADTTVDMNNAAWRAELARFASEHYGHRDVVELPQDEGMS